MITAVYEHTKPNCDPLLYQVLSVPNLQVLDLYDNVIEVRRLHAQSKYVFIQRSLMSKNLRHMFG